jgi:serine/threonine-protein kinase
LDRQVDANTIDMISAREYPQVPGYEVLELRAVNGHLVYLARHLRSGCLVDLHVVNSGGEFGLMVAAKLRRQASVLARLDHPSILRPVEVGEAAGHGFYSALEHAPGGCLANKIRAVPLLWTDATVIVRAIALALQHARSRNVVQEDLSPSSILLAADTVPKLAGFRALGEREHMPGVKILTLGYAAPEEIAEFGNLDPSSGTDVYRVGAVLYGMLTGQPPFSERHHPNERLRQLIDQSPVPVRDLNDAVPRDLEAVCMKCLEKQPLHRYAQPADLVDPLGKVLTDNHRTA